MDTYFNFNRYRALHAPSSGTHRSRQATFYAGNNTELNWPQELDRCQFKLMSSLDRIAEKAMRRLAEMERDPAYRMLQRHLEQEQRNPSLRIAREMAQRQMEEEQRNPSLRILREKIHRELSDPHHRIVRQRLDEASQYHSLFALSNRALEQFNHYFVNDRRREWERDSSFWLYGQNKERTSAFTHIVKQITDAEPASFGLGQTHINLRSFERNYDLNRINDLTKAFSALAGYQRPELDNTFLFATAKRLSQIQYLSQMHNAEMLDQEFDSFIEYIQSIIKAMGSRFVNREVILTILFPIIVAALQQAQSYKWRLEDKVESDKRIEEQTSKIDALLQALNQLEQKLERPKIGKPYLIERTTSTFSRPGQKGQRIGFVYEGQSTLAVGSTGRWILIEYVDPISLEQRVGWIRKKYAKLQQTLSKSVPTNNARLLVAIDFYKGGEVSLGQAADIANLSKKAFIDVLGEQKIPILNYSPEELAAEIGE